MKSELNLVANENLASLRIPLAGGSQVTSRMGSRKYTRMEDWMDPIYVIAGTTSPFVAKDDPRPGG